MWLYVLLLFGPLIYFIISPIVDLFSIKTNEINRDRYHGEEELINISTRNNDNISKEDIMLLFVSQFKRYKQRNYNIDYKVFNGKEDQNYAWSIKTTKQTFGWGIIYYIRFHFSNGWFYISFSNKDFYSNGIKSTHYYIGGIDIGTLDIESKLANCKNEAEIMWKANGREPTEYLPFDYIPLSSNRAEQQDEDDTQNSNANQVDLINFYRSLLGLNLNFSHAELKKCYHEAVGKYHPDRYSSSSTRDRENAEMLMKQVNEAYEILKEVAE